VRVGDRLRSKVADEDNGLRRSTVLVGGELALTGVVERQSERDRKKLIDEKFEAAWESGLGRGCCCE